MAVTMVAMLAMPLLGASADADIIVQSVGRLLEEKEEEDEEEDEVDPQTQAATVMIILTLMVFFSVLFEMATDKLKRTVRSDAPNLMPVVDSLFSELTLLGFIGLSLFIIDKLQMVQDLSEDMFHEEEAIGELCESVHMALFLVMVIFMGNVILLVQFGVTITAQWKDWEDNILAKKGLLADLTKLQSRTVGCVAYISPTEPEAFQKVTYASIREPFCKNLDEHFSFAEYLNRRLGFHLGELVEVPVNTWAGLWVFMFGFYTIHEMVGYEVQIIVIMMMAYFLVFLMKALHDKLREIKYNASDLSYIKEAEPPQGSLEESSNLIDRPDTPAFWASFCPITYTVAGLAKRYGKQKEFGEESYHHLFWTGTRESPDIVLAMIRYCLLCNAIYMAVCILMIFPMMSLYISEGKLESHEAFVITTLAIIPPVALVVLTPHTVKDFVIVSNIQSMKNKRVVEETKRRMKTRFAFLVLKVVYMMLKGFEQSKIEHSESFKTGINSRQAKETETQKLRKRNVWEKIFAVFDGGADGEIGNDEGDGDGKLTHKELHDLLKRITGGKSKFTEADITGIINRLDENGDGDIDFEEFFKYVTEITDNSDETPEEISNGIFDLVDQPDEDEEEEEEGEEKHEHQATCVDQILYCCKPEEEEDEEGPSISITELQKVLEKTGQELPADEVLEIVSDIDVNGDGQLDREEFFTLLKRLDVFS